MNLANKITVFRIFLIPVFLIVYMGSFFDDPIRNYVAVAIFIIASLTDMLDGYIARSRNLITNFGKFADPLADKLLVCSAMIAMVEKGILPSIAVIIIICREFLVTGFRLVAVEKSIVIAAGFWGKLKTVFQMLMVIFVLLNIEGDSFRVAESVIIWTTVLLTIMSAIEYISHNADVFSDR